jgi:hypothetical protein
MLLHIQILYFLFKFMEQIVMMIRFYCLPFSIHVLLLLCPFSVIALRNSNSKFEFKAIPVESSRPLGLMRPPRAAERSSFDSCLRGPAAPPAPTRPAGQGQAAHPSPSRSVLSSSGWPPAVPLNLHSPLFLPRHASAAS